MVTLGEGRQDTRRRVARSELDALEVEREAIDIVVDTFGHHRLLTFDREPSTREPTVEIAHEALLSAWGRLRTWIDDAREDLRQERGLARAAAEWRGSDGDESFLVRGARLEQLETWAATTDLAIGRSERAYLKASVDQRDREREEEERRREREARIERRSTRRLRGLVAVFAAAALIAGSLTVVATNQSGRAEREARIAKARELATAAVANLEVDPELSVLLAIEAVQTTRSSDGTVLPEAEEALHRAVVASRLELEVPGVGGRLAWSPAGVFVTEGPEDSGIIDIRDGETGEQRPLVPGTRRGRQRRRVQLGRLEARLHRRRRQAEGVGSLDRAARLEPVGRWRCMGSFLRRRRFARRRGLARRGEVRVLDLSTDRVVSTRACGRSD